MATTTLIIYEPIENFKEKQSYWQSYVQFYEKYWGGPPSPLGVWFGNEYNIFRRKLSEELDIDEEELVDCFFLRDDKGKYYIAPPGNDKNIFSNRDFIPIEWFYLFSENERKELHSHWGFNAIHYTASLSDAVERLSSALAVIDEAREDDQIKQVDATLKPQLDMISSGINNLLELLSSFDNTGFIVLNYGDICSVIHPYTLKNEKSVQEVSDLIEMLENKKYRDAASFLGIFSEKWDEIRRKCSGEIDKTPIQ